MNLNSTDTRQIRIFGFTALLFFGCLAGAGIWLGKAFPTYFFGALSVLGMGFVLFPNPLRPVFLAWLKIAHFIGRCVNALMLTLAYYLVITPAAFIKRVFGGRPLPVKPDRELPSYWVTRKEAAQPREQFLKRF